MKIWAPAVLTASLLASGSGYLRAQNPSLSAPAAKSAYPAESLVFDQLSRIYRYAADGSGSEEITGVIEIHNQAAVKALSVISFAFASSSQHVEIDYVRVRHADGSVDATPATDAQELPAQVTRDAPFYSDIKEEQIPIRGLREGDLLEYKVRIVRTRPEAPGHFWGSESFFTPSSGFVILSELVELHVPKTSYIQVWSPQYKSTLTRTADENVYRWQSAQLKPVAGKEKNALLLMDNNPTLGTNDDPKLLNIAWTNFHSWAEVGAWYRGLEGARTVPDDDVRSRVSTLIAGKSTEEEKARAIYGFVGPQIRYIGVAFGIGRYQPHDAGDVLSNQYGDCKDKATLLTSMFSAAGITADTVLIGAGITFNEAVPSPASFNHAITLAHIDGKPVWLDSTAEVAPYRLLNPILRGKQALVIPLVGEGHLETTPKDPPFPSEIHFEAVGTLDDQGTSHSHMVMDLRGDVETIYRQAVRTVSPAQWDELMQRVSQAMSFGGKVTNAAFSRPDDTAAPFHITYDYERDKNGDWDNLRILPQLPLLGLADVDEKDPPVTPIDIGIPHVEVDHVVMKLPKGWRAELPPSIHAKTGFAILDKTYKFENGTLTTDRRFEVLVEKIPAANWRVYHQWFKDAGLDGETYIQLTNPSVSGGDAAHQPGAGTPTPNNPVALDLLRQATRAARSNDWTTAKAKLVQAQATDPDQPYLWSVYGYLAMHDGNMSDAIADFRRELAAHPDESSVTLLLAQTLLRQKKPEDAISVLQAAIGRNPADEITAIALSAMLAQRGDNPAAEKVLRSGLAAKPDSLKFKTSLGLLLLHEHKNDEAEALLRDVLTRSDDPLQINNAAYYIADASLDLPLAEKSSRHSLDLLDLATNDAKTSAVAIGRSSLLTHAWDTLGWILYREGKFSDAEPWARAAWRNTNSAESGYHLALILEKENRLPEALNQLQLAQVGGGNSDALQKLVADKLSDLRKSAAPTDKNDPSQELQLARTYKIPRGKLKPKGQGWATVELDVTTQGTTAVRIVSGDQSLQPLSSAVQNLNLNLQLPPASHATLVRRGILACGDADTTCQLVLIPPQAVSIP